MLQVPRSTGQSLHLPVRSMITLKWTVAIVLLISTVESLRAQVRNTEEDLPNATGEFTNAQSENDRANAQLLAMKLRFRLEFSAKPTQNDGPSEVSWVNWDGENLIVDSERFVYVSTPYRAFLLTRDKAANPLSIQFITPISPEKRSVEDIIKFDLKVGDGYVAHKSDLSHPGKNRVRLVADGFP